MCHLTAQTRPVSLLAAPGLLACPIRSTVVLATSSARVNEARGQPFLVTSPGAGCPPGVLAVGETLGAVRIREGARAAAPRRAH